MPKKLLPAYSWDVDAKRTLNYVGRLAAPWHKFSPPSSTASLSAAEQCNVHRGVGESTTPSQQGMSHPALHSVGPRVASLQGSRLFLAFDLYFLAISARVPGPEEFSALVKRPFGKREVMASEYPQITASLFPQAMTVRRS